MIASVSPKYCLQALKSPLNGCFNFFSLEVFILGLRDSREKKREERS